MTEYSIPRAFQRAVLAALVLSAPCLLVAQQHPDLLAYEGFDYAANESLEFKDGGVGWGGEWTFRTMIDGKGAVIFNAAMIEEGSLTYGGLVTTGNHAHFYGDLGKLEMARRLASVIPGNDGDTTYMSFVGQRVGPEVDTNVADPYWDDPDTPEREPYPFGDNLYPRGASLRFWNAINRERLAVGNFFNRTTDTWMAYGGGLLHKTDDSFSNAPAFVVVRVDHHGNDDPLTDDSNTADDLYMWINPDLSRGEDLGAADLVLIGPYDVNDDTIPWDLSDISWISPFADNSSDVLPHAELLVDEIRIGTSWDAVVPVENTGATWAGFAIYDTSLVDTAGFLGILDIRYSPWIWSFELEAFLYLPEEQVTASGGWTYLPRIP